jgi:pyridinium-3,5-biscarboxylic acid mononucleotide sulfurtransferase
LYQLLSLYQYIIIMPTATRRYKEAASENDLQDTELERVRANIRLHRSALIAFSGGVDSSVVAMLAKQALGDAVVAVTVNNGVLHHGELEHAAEIAKAIGIRHLSIAFDPLTMPEIKHNNPERCYHCKMLTFSTLRGLADEMHLNTVMDGTNASDLNVYRPGLRALKELGIFSPLLTLTKEEVRGFARTLGLPNSDVPSNACLLTSFPYGTVVTKERVERLRQAECALNAIGITRAKVRDHNNFARIEVDKEAANDIVRNSAAIVEAFVKLGFAYVTLDLAWLRSGSMDMALNSTYKKNSAKPP